MYFWSMRASITRYFSLPIEWMLTFLKPRYQLVQHARIRKRVSSSFPLWLVECLRCLHTLTTKCENPSSTFCTAPLVWQKNLGAIGLECALRQVMFQLAAWRAQTGFIHGLSVDAACPQRHSLKGALEMPFSMSPWKQRHMYGTTFFWRKKIITAPGTWNLGKCKACGDAPVFPTSIIVNQLVLLWPQWRH